MPMEREQMSGSQLIRELRRIFCTLGAGTIFVFGTATALGGNDSSSGCNAPGHHYGFTCDPAPSGTDTPTPAPSPPSPVTDPAPAPAPSPPAPAGKPIPARAVKIPRAAAGGSFRFARA